jgi:predicted nucleotidyltransferase
MLKNILIFFVISVFFLIFGPKLVLLNTNVLSSERRGQNLFWTMPSHEKRLNLLNIINKLQRVLPLYPIEKAWVFGSYSRGEETSRSDIDILVRFDKNAHVTLFEYAGIMNDLQDLLHKKVDLVQEGQLKNFAKESAEQNKILIYER